MIGANKKNLQLLDIVECVETCKLDLVLLVGGLPDEEQNNVATSLTVRITIKARGGSRLLGHILPQSNFHVKIIFELLTCPCKQFIKLAVHVCRIAEINLQMS